VKHLLFASVLLAPLPALADPPQIVTDIAPVHSLVAQVMAGVGTPDLLVSGATDPHSVALKPSQARLLEQADLVIWMGADLEPWLERALDGLARAETIALLDLPATTLREFSDADVHLHEEENATLLGEEDAADGEEHDHDHAGTDPHAWLSPDNARAWLGSLAEELAARDPDNAGLYQENAQAAIVEISRLDAEISARLDPFNGAEIVTMHDAFGYFAGSYGLDVIGTVKPGDASAPSAAALSDLRDLVADHGVECAFSEPGADPDLLAAIEQGTGLRTGVLDATGTTLEPGPELYAALMTGLATTLETCLSGGSD